MSLPGRPILTSPTSMYELYRSHSKLIWSTSDDPFARYVVHCCCRYHNIVSFSMSKLFDFMLAVPSSCTSSGKETGGMRCTHILRPTAHLADIRAATILNTPPATDLDSASSIPADSDSIYHSDDIEGMCQSLASISEPLAPFANPTAQPAAIEEAGIGVWDEDIALQEIDDPTSQSSNPACSWQSARGVASSRCASRRDDSPEHSLNALRWRSAQVLEPSLWTYVFADVR